MNVELSRRRSTLANLTLSNVNLCFALWDYPSNLDLRALGTDVFNFTFLKSHLVISVFYKASWWMSWRYRTWRQIKSSVSEGRQG